MSALSSQCSVLFVIPPGWPGMAAHHEATSGMGALTPGDRPFLYAPHTVATCAAVTRGAGLRTTVLDGCAGSASSDRGSLDPTGPLLSAIVAEQADVLALFVSHGTAHADENFLRLVRERLGASGRRSLARRELPTLRQSWQLRRVLLFGPSAHFVAAPWVEEGLADAALLGEPEGAIADAVMRLAAGDLTGSVPASTLRPDLYAAPTARPGDGAPASGGPDTQGGGAGRDLIADLDALPFPDWDLAPWQPYGAASVLSSRGCGAGCGYCGYVVAQGKRFRAQSPARTVAELAWLAEAGRPPAVQVRDPVFAQDRSRVVAICEGLLAKDTKLSLACESRPEHFDDELLALLAAAGCATVKIGLESTDPALLVRLGRVGGGAERVAASSTELATLPSARVEAETYVAHAARVARTCRRLGMTCQLFVMAGLPGQDARSLAHTAATLRRLPRETMIRAKPYQFHPGTALVEPSASVATETLEQLAYDRAAALWDIRSVVRRGRSAIRRIARRLTAEG